MIKKYRPLPSKSTYNGIQYNFTLSISFGKGNCMLMTSDVSFQTPASNTHKTLNETQTITNIALTRIQDTGQCECRWWRKSLVAHSHDRRWTQGLIRDQLTAGNLSRSTAGQQLLTTWPKPCSSVALRWQSHVRHAPTSVIKKICIKKRKLVLRPGDWNNLQPDKIISKPGGGQVIRFPI